MATKNEGNEDKRQQVKETTSQRIYTTDSHTLLQWKI